MFDLQNQTPRIGCMEKPVVDSTQTDELWTSVLSEIELQVSKPNFITWFKNSKLIENRDGVALIALPNNFAKEWVESKYHKLILGSLRSVNGSTKNIEYVVEGSLSQKVISRRRRNIVQSEPDEKQLAFQEMRVDPETNLNPKYSLDSFIVGGFNELAYTAAMAIVEDVGHKYNPLFIYGGVGLGKTHLIQGIGNEVRRLSNNEVGVKYVTSEKFTNDVIWAIRNRRVEDIKKNYRNVDVLIIDDIQFLGGKEMTQQEFFHTFNALHENNKQIIISSDRPPSSIATLEERLRSRFEGGMVADISFPEYESRLAIAKSKLQDRGIMLEDKILEIVAKKVQNNIREIEGILNKLVFHQITYKRPLDLITAEQIISEVTNKSITRATPNQIIKTVGNFFEISPNELVGRSRSKEYVKPRQIAMYLLRELLNMSYPDIASKVGKRDHTTAIYACKKVSREVSSDNDLSQKIIMIKDDVNKIG
ncbi:MAG: chromosomal replication initiator protein DnaA [Candidatus Colwellbacteria bacterium CG10_big_fil_rev_8_21_14_0_10_41_28]|uniref:Chromosomal replication initiator protein DnaA n=1 Tax=Candidatus Colwellbacteria bacterium CG10_big_fil_rev_8_21_14_0_10_41_28 TaxID=1974539 RepID=A0A2H0VHN1_9BACT|nr:MAG: chromosomal replication initiator protein DnaA [Candidatus Colwellbacteria bacterium CG10_big_fil_rev_8_21_14_0_10_41_28]